VSWDRLCPGFLAASKRMEEADPKHTYKYFPGQEAWTWEKQPGYVDNRLAAWRGPLNMNGLAHEAWEEGQWEAQARDSTRTRGDGWPAWMNMNRADAGELKVGHTSERGPSRQRRLDVFPLTAPGGGTFNHHTNMAT